MRKVAAEAIVLLKNEGNVLPLKQPELKKVAILGGSAKAVVVSGGGSAALKPSYFVSPYDGIVNALGNDVEITYAEGARSMYFFLIYDFSVSFSCTIIFVAFKTLPLLDYDLETENGERGWIGTWYSNGPDGLTAVGDPVKTQLIDETNAFISIDKPKGVASHFTLHLRGKLKPRTEDMKFEFGLTVSGRAKVSAILCYTISITRFKKRIKHG